MYASELVNPPWAILECSASTASSRVWAVCLESASLWHTSQAGGFHIASSLGKVIRYGVNSMPPSGKPLRQENLDLWSAMIIPSV